MSHNIYNRNNKRTKGMTGTTAKLQPFHTAPSIEARKAPLPAPALDTWWEGFRDPELTHIVQRAIDQNLDLAAALTRVEQARAAAREAGTRFKPSGALTAQADSFRQSLESPAGRFARTSPTYERNQSYLDLGLAATWERDVFGDPRRSKSLDLRKGPDCNRRTSAPTGFPTQGGRDRLRSGASPGGSRAGAGAIHH